MGSWHGARSAEGPRAEDQQQRRPLQRGQGRYAAVYQPLLRQPDDLQRALQEPGRSVQLQVVPALCGAGVLTERSLGLAHA